MILHITWKLCCLVFIYASNTGFLLYLVYRLHPQRALSLITCPSETVKKKKKEEENMFQDCLRQWFSFQKNNH